MNKYSRQPGDSILALLEPGEYVLNRNAVDEIGRENLDDLNYDDAPRFDMSQRGQFQAGGMLGDMIGMQGGGSTLSYGGATSETQSLDDMYQRMGITPTPEQKEKFEKQYAYDPSREGVLFEDYGRAITGATQAGQQNLMGAGQQMQQTQAKSGFAGGGAGQQAQQQARGTIMKDFLAQEGAAKSALFKGVRGEREKWMADVGAGLSQLQGAEGTEDYTSDPTPDNPWDVPEDDESWNPPSQPSHGLVYKLGTENYYWNSDTNAWETEEDWNQGQQQGQRGDDDYYASDVRLKKDINYLFTMNNGVPIYTFKYKWSDDVSIGTMAHDIEDMIPEAVLTNSNGYKMVNYSKVFNYGKI
jgi:hypothetical protein